jgi:NAD(P)-dependent dehydrogenase (short-subunit alcohol dehydrogenase family)
MGNVVHMREEESMDRLAGKTAFLTAAGAGIGRATALAFAREGAVVVATDRDEVALESLRHELAGIDAGHEVMALDVVDHDAVRRAAARHKDTDILFNCAGWVHQGTVLQTSLENWQRSFDINVTAMFVLIQAFLPGLIDRGGASIINVASVASSLKGIVNRAAYSASKAAVIGLSKSVAADYIGQKVRVNTICPGTIDSPSLHERASSTGDAEAAMKMFVARQPIGRLGTPAEVAALAVFLASEEAAYTTGADFVMDGGITL